MIEIPLNLVNDQADALRRVLPEMMAAMMAETALEETTPERTDDLTKARAILGDIQNRVVRALDVIAQLDREERKAERANARLKFSRTRTRRPN